MQQKRIISQRVGGPLPGDGGQLEGAGETLVALGVVVLEGHLWRAEHEDRKPQTPPSQPTEAQPSWHNRSKSMTTEHRFWSVFERRFIYSCY